MNKILIATLLSLLLPQTWAQNPQEKIECTKKQERAGECKRDKKWEDKDSPRGEKRGWKKGHSGYFFNKMVKKLDLRADQKQKLEEFRNSRMEVRKSEKEHHHKLHLELRKALLTRPTPTASISSIQQKLVEMESKKIQHRVDNMIFLISILDEAQFARLQGLMPERPMPKSEED